LAATLFSPIHNLLYVTYSSSASSLQQFHMQLHVYISAKVHCHCQNLAGGTVIRRS